MSAPAAATPALDLRKTISPTQKQQEFLDAIAQKSYVLYGGAAGGGKSYILRWWLVLTVLKAFALHGVRGAQAGLFCEDYPALQNRHLSVWGGVRGMNALGEIRKTEKEGLRFKLRDELGGGMVLLRNLDDPSKYDSAEFIAVGVDEWTKNPWDVFDQLRKRLRWATVADEPHLPCGGLVTNRNGHLVECAIPNHDCLPTWNYPFAKTANPGGVGHAETKRVYIDHVFPDNLEPLASQFGFIKALSSDNPFNPVDYKAKNLDTLPEKLRRAYADGDWDVFEGQYFTEFDPQKRKISPDLAGGLIKPWWQRWISMDWGFTHYSAIYWHAKGKVSPEDARKYLGREWAAEQEAVVTYRERVQAGVTNKQLGAIIVQGTGEDKITRFFLSPDTKQRRGSEHTIREEISDVTRDGGLPEVDDADDQRIAGWNLMRQLIHDDTWFISTACPEALNAIPVLSHDELAPEDVEKTADKSDDVADALRYGLKSMLNAGTKPREIIQAEHMAKVYQATGDLTSVHMANLRWQQQNKMPQWGRRRR